MELPNLPLPQLIYQYPLSNQPGENRRGQGGPNGKARSPTFPASIETGHRRPNVGPICKEVYG